MIKIKNRLEIIKANDRNDKTFDYNNQFKLNQLNIIKLEENLHSTIHYGMFCR